MDAISKRYYTIGEVSELLQVSPSLIRFWETQFETLRPRKNKNGVRQYTRQDIELLQSVYHLVKEKGYTLNGAREALRQKPQIVQTQELIESMERIRSFLEELRVRIDQSNHPATGQTSTREE